MSVRQFTWAVLFAATLLIAAGTACSGAANGAGAAADAAAGQATRPAVRDGLAVAVFAGGCFWCMEGPFEKLDGVDSVISGYAGGPEKNPTYAQVSAGRTGHAEAVQVSYDPSRVDYRTLLDVYWRQIDPTDAGGQFADRGTQYRTVIFYGNEEERALAEASKAELEQSGRFDKPLVPEIVPAGEFYPAEAYHQDYYKTNPDHYKSYRRGSGREGYLNEVWGPDPQLPVRKPAVKQDKEAFVKPSDEELKQKLDPLQYRVTQQDGTERPFDNAYWDNKRDGIYVDVVSGEPLFSSIDKFESGTGWPSFTQPLVPENVVEHEDRKLFMKRTEVRSKNADSHLGHVFPDGPQPTGQRYCMNSAAMRFIPKEDLEQEGYGEFLKLFE